MLWSAISQVRLHGVPGQTSVYVSDLVESKEKYGVCGTPGVDYNLTLCPLHSRLQHIYYGQPYAGVDLTLCQRRLYPPNQGL